MGNLPVRARGGRVPNINATVSYVAKGAVAPVSISKDFNTLQAAGNTSTQLACGLMAAQCGYWIDVRDNKIYAYDPSN